MPKNLIFFAFGCDYFGLGGVLRYQGFFTGIY